MRGLAAMSLVPGRGVDPEAGTLADVLGVACNWMPAPVGAGDILAPHAGVDLEVFFYDDQVDPNLIYTYSYQNESNWASYRPDLSRTAWSADGFVCPVDGFVRVVVRLGDGEDVRRGTKVRDLVDVTSAEHAERPLPEHFRAEAERVARRVAELRQPGDLVLMLVSDVHWSAGCPWDDTVRNLREVARLVSPDALVQLGDLTDGLAPAWVTREVVGDLLDDLRSTRLPVYGCVGNHDANYFRGNPDSLDRRERTMLYLGQRSPWYHVDFPERRVRALFLDSFEPTRKERYGFSAPQLAWVARTLATTPKGWGVVVFSHVPLLASMHVWSKRIRLGVTLRRMLQVFDRARGGALITYVHGHNHSDQVAYTHGFPIVAVGCAKLEDFWDHKPHGSVTPARKLGDVTQELWDVVVVSADRRRADFVRFGAGEERGVAHGGA